MAVIDTLLQQESRDRYLTYALSVVSGRALPDVRDGLKPVQRRILFTMLKNLGLRPSSGYRKSAKVVGEVLGSFHPHGDIPCYEAMARMVQDFSLRYPLVDGQGNYGSVDGDNPAAYRYTEARLTELAIEVIGEIDEETVDYRSNFDATLVEPVVLPSRVPNLLINGASGIAVGMATSVPPHNLKDVAKALVELSNDPELSETKLAGLVKAPDFPTGGQILNTRTELNEIYKTGRGSIRLRGEWSTEEGNRGKKYIIITSIPYAVNKSQLVERIAALIIERKVPQLTDVRDESTNIVRIVLELANEADPELAMAYIFKNTPLEINFAVNLTALAPTGVGGALRPELLSLKACLQHFLDFRQLVTVRKLTYEKKKLLERIHILEALVLIYDCLNEVIKIVRASDGRLDAAEKLRARFKLSEVQSFAVVDMRIYQLSKTNILEIRQELKEKTARVGEIDALLKSQAKIKAIVRKDLEDLADKFGDKRRTQLVKDHIEVEISEEDFVVQEDVYAIVTRDGWLKRIRQNNELGATRLREGDQIAKAHALNTVDSVAFITNLGFIYTLRVADFPSSSGYGDPVQKVLKFKDGESIVESFPIRIKKEVQGELFKDLRSLQEGDELVLVSQHGTGFISKINDILGLKRNGKRVMKLREGDQLAAACFRESKLAMFTANGSGLVIETKEAPVNENPIVGIALMGIREDDRLVAAVCFARQSTLVVTLDGGRTKEIKSADLEFGHRALKGTKIGVRDEVKFVTLKE